MKLTYVMAMLFSVLLVSSCASKSCCEKKKEDTKKKTQECDMVKEEKII